MGQGIISPDIDKIKGLLLGTAVGDSVGLPAEGISKQRIKKLYKGEIDHRLLFGRGMISDDTEHTLFVVQSLIASGQSVEAFSKNLAMHLKLWLLSLPAGVGFATLRSIVRLWVGFSPQNSGVISAGNGPAMRVSPIGVFFAYDAEKRDAFVAASTGMTHRDPRSLVGAKAVADLVAWVVRESPKNPPEIDIFKSMLLSVGLGDKEWEGLVELMIPHLRSDDSVEDFAMHMGQGKGISGYIYHTVALVIYAWYRHFGDFRKTISSVFRCGGDTDTTCAIAGALQGVTVGGAGIPGVWIDGIWEWPRSKRFMEKVALRFSECIQEDQAKCKVSCLWLGIFPRNVFFLVVVLLHGFRRILPPY